MGFEENSSDVLAINHVILIAKMCISKYRYGKYLICCIYLKEN